ncbi:MAG: hypothetical protein EBS05_08200 [Proteobacteria bacterium]|jgi:hypothetical protein|nr:hypothetical protein [Pseudomonadota bacterium]
MHDTLPYVDFRRFFVTRQNADLVTMTRWRQAVARVFNAELASDRNVRRRASKLNPPACS